MSEELVQAEVVSTSIVEQLTKGEVLMQVETANRFPRSIDAFRKKTLTLATKDADTAKSCFYVLPRGGKQIEGPSVRLAEIVASAYKNLRCETRVVDEGEKTVTAQASVWDMENNVLIRVETQRRITNKSGQRYNDDMIVMTGNAACSIALRNAIFRVVPRAYIDPIYTRCKQVALGGKGVDQAKAEWLAFYSKAGVSEARVLSLLGKKHVDDMDLEDVTTLQGLHTALQDGSTTVEDAFPPEPLKDGSHDFEFKKRAKAPPKPPRPPVEYFREDERPPKTKKPKAKKPEAKDPPHDQVTGEVLDEENPPPVDQDRLEF